MNPQGIDAAFPAQLKCDEEPLPCDESQLRSMGRKNGREPFFFNAHASAAQQRSLMKQLSYFSALEILSIPSHAVPYRIF